jgi:hypothetical protein
LNISGQIKVRKNEEGNYYTYVKASERDEQGGYKNSFSRVALKFSCPHDELLNKGMIKLNDGDAFLGLCRSGTRTYINVIIMNYELIDKGVPELDPKYQPKQTQPTEATNNGFDYSYTQDDLPF